MDNASATRLVGCHPVVLDRLSLLEQRLDFELEVVQGKRTFNLQSAFYARGRESLEVVNELYQAVGLAPLTPEENLRTVTKARAGFGWHEYGLAIDVAPFDENHKLDWDVAHPRWQQLLSAATIVGFAEGAAWRTFPDNPHLYPSELPSSPDDAVRYAWKSGGLDAVWRHVAEEYKLS